MTKTSEYANLTYLVRESFPVLVLSVFDVAVPDYQKYNFEEVNFVPVGCQKLFHSLNSDAASRDSLC